MAEESLPSVVGSILGRGSENSSFVPKAVPLTAKLENFSYLSQCVF